MKGCKGVAAALLAALLFAFSWVPVKALDLPVASNNAATWLQTSTPEPGIGDEDVVLALLRGGYVTATQEYTQGYLRKLVAHANAGGIPAQSIEQSARQALVMAAAGVDIQSNAPALLTALSDLAAINAEGLRAQAAVLLLYATGAEALGEARIDLPALATALADTRHSGGGFGAPDALSTALAIQALAGYKDVNGVEDAIIYGETYLMLSANDFGGFNMDGNPSALATAEAILMVGCLGRDPVLIDDDSASLQDALSVFQNEDGSFAANPDTEPTAQLTAKGLMAYLAKLRFDRMKTPFYDFTDVTPIEISAEEPENPQPGGVISSANTPGGNQSGAQWGVPAIPMWLLLVVIGVVLFVLILLIVSLTRRHKLATGAATPKEKGIIMREMPRSTAAKPAQSRKAPRPQQQGSAATAAQRPAESPPPAKTPRQAEGRTRASVATPGTPTPAAAPKQTAQPPQQKAFQRSAAPSSRQASSPKNKDEKIVYKRRK